MLLQARWREHLTRLISGWWIADQRYYRLGLLSRIKSAPEYRIAEDVRLAIEPLVEMTIGLISASRLRPSLPCSGRWGLRRACDHGRTVVGIVRQQGLIALVLNTNSALFPVVPLLLIAPKYLYGSVTLGAVVQVVAAFSAVQTALIWFVDNFVRLAEWFA
jgi:ABC-type uncharacterized transport system fused permease/ATPase subunit